MALVVEATIERDLGNGCVQHEQEILSALYTAVGKPSVPRNECRPAKGLRKMTDRQSTRSGQIREANLAVKARGNHVVGKAFLPNGRPAFGERTRANVIDTTRCAIGCNRPADMIED